MEKQNKNAETEFEPREVKEEDYDPSVAFRTVTGKVAILVIGLLASMSVYHLYAAGFGLFRDLVHRSVHLSFILGLVFLLFGARKKPITPNAWYVIGGVPLWDYFLAILAVISVCYLPNISSVDLAQRVGNPNSTDILMGTILLFCVIEATRRAVGTSLTVICMIFIAYALWGQVAPGILKHTGTSWLGLINHLYLTNQGIYGIAIGVVAQYVFLFVLFGVLATKVGLGQLFIDLAQAVAGRYAGGPAKVAIFSSAMMGTISGSSIANTVTTGSLTIPAMKKVGYEPHFAGAVEATSSTGGQITPPIMGAAAFVMVEFLQIPYREILLAALLPACMHYFGIFTMVHLEAKRLNLRGLRKDEMPQVLQVLKRHWLTLFPLLLLIYLIISGRTPDYAAFWGIVAVITVGFVKPHDNLTIKQLIDGFALGAKYALSVGAAAAAVGIIVGVVTLTGTGFRLSAMITQGASDLAGFFTIGILSYVFSVQGLTLLFTLIFTAMACILMGAGIPTTATYIILVSVAAPALVILGIDPLVAHFFVFYYGVLADITPPVALAAYAGAGIAGANPFKTGNTAFRLGIAKALVPFVFVYSPSFLLVVDGFSWHEFTLALLGAMAGISTLAAAFTGYIIVPMPKYQRQWLGVVALIFIAPGLYTLLLGFVLVIPVLVAQWLAKKKLTAT
ncbi:MAG: TRAP transporter permease [Alphaproteobacteria bacterium]|nr:TRAP transporter permease [Alphaproteobacteria bacterium]